MDFLLYDARHLDFILRVLSQRDAVIVGTGGGQPGLQIFIQVSGRQQIAGDILHGQMLTQAAQANHVFTHGAVTHLRLFKQELLEADNIEEVALLFAVEIATETAKRYPLFLLVWLCLKSFR